MRWSNLSIRFLNRVIPKENESLYSFLFRTARANYFKHITEIIPNHGFYQVNCNDLSSNQQWVDIVQGIAPNLNLDINNMVCDQFDENFRMDNQEEKFLKSNIRRMFYLNKFTKFCPDCLREDFYHRIHWDIALITTCTKHKARLILQCSNCNSHINMHTFMRGECKCGFNILSTATEKVKDSTIISNQTILHASLINGQGIVRSDGVILNSKEYLLLFSLFFQLLRFLPTSHLIEEPYSSIYESFYSNQTEIEDCLIEYMDILVPLINNLVIEPEKALLLFYLTLDKLKDDRSAKTIPSKKSSILKIIFELPKGGIYADYYEDFNLNHKEYFLHRDGIIQLDPYKKKFLGIAEAQRLLGRSKKFIDKLCEAKHLKYKKVEVNGKTLTLYEKESILKWHKYSQTIMSSMDAKKYLGANKRQILELIDAGILQPVHSPTIDGMKSYYVKKKDVYKLEEKLQSICKKFTKVNDSWMDLFAAKYKFTRSSFSFLDLLYSVMNCEIKAVHLTSQPIIKGLYFSEDEVIAFRLKILKKFVVEKGYNKEELKRIFSLQSADLDTWFKSGYLHVDYTINRGEQLLPHANRDQVLIILTERMGFTKKQAFEHLNRLDERFSRMN